MIGSRKLILFLIPLYDRRRRRTSPIYGNIVLSKIGGLIRPGCNSFFRIPDSLLHQSLGIIEREAKRTLPMPFAFLC